MNKLHFNELTSYFPVKLAEAIGKNKTLEFLSIQDTKLFGNSHLMLNNVEGNTTLKEINFNNTTLEVKALGKWL